MLSDTTARVVAVDTHDIRFPTSREIDDPNPMHPDPDSSAAHLIPRTETPDDPAAADIPTTKVSA
ncbi:hypothetical protein [Embleya scabrispora]|uniref:hypothetical protein n=1 Tax=Embleya scabrispora TaxID=159449 RepID=UPI000478054E|nr:hypothetical protein [Streptomyces sp. SID5474]